MRWPSSPRLTADDLEFVEIHNPTTQEWNLTGWRIAGGIDFEFADGTVLLPGETLVVVSFNPTTPANANRAAAFRAHYDLDQVTQIVGGYSQQLNDQGELLQLLQLLHRRVRIPTRTRCCWPTRYSTTTGLRGPRSPREVE